MIGHDEKQAPPKCINNAIEWYFLRYLDSKEQTYL
jgi:hypothetical protein